MIDRLAAEAFVQSALDAALSSLSLSAYADMAPDGAAPPYVVFGNSTSLDTETNGDVRVMAQFPFTVRAVLSGNVSAGAVEDAIETALDGVRQAVVGNFLINSKRDGALSSLSPQLGRTYRYAGGRYLVTVRTRT